MKLNKLIILLLACFTFVACSNDQENSEPTPRKEVKSMTVNVAYQSSKLRSLDEQSQVNKYAPINSLQLIIADNTTNAIYVNEAISKTDLDDLSSQTGSNGTPAEKIYEKTYTGLPSTATKVYVVANLPSSIDPSSFNNLANLKNAVGITFDNQNANKSAANVVIQGEEIATLSGEVHNATVILIPIVSRIEIAKISLDKVTTDDQGRIVNKIKTYKVEAVYINSYYGGTTLSPVLQGSNIMNAETTGTTNQTQLEAAPNYTPAVKTIIGGPLPTSKNEIVAYNFFPSQLPHILIKISDIVYDGTGLDGLPTEGWITIQKYSTDGIVEYPKPAEKGSVYTIDEVAFTQADLGPNPYIKTIRLIATIKVKPWTEVALKPIL